MEKGKSDTEIVQDLEEFIQEYINFGQSWEMYTLLEKRDEAIIKMYWASGLHSRMSVREAKAEALYEGKKASLWEEAKGAKGDNGKALSDRRADMYVKERIERYLVEVARSKGLVLKAKALKETLYELVQSMKQRISVSRAENWGQV